MIGSMVIDIPLLFLASFLLKITLGIAKNPG